MTDQDRDPHLQQWFATSEVELVDESFTRAVADRLPARRRPLVATAGVLLAVLLGLAMTFDEAAVALASLIARQVVELDPGGLGDLLAPINSIGGVVALALLGLRVAYRRLFG